MRFIVAPTGGKYWQWRLIDEETGQVHAEGTEDTPKEARRAAQSFRGRVFLAPIEMGT